MGARNRTVRERTIKEETIDLTCDNHLYYKGSKCSARATVDAEHWDKYGNGGLKGWVRVTAPYGQVDTCAACGHSEPKKLALCDEHRPQTDDDSPYDRSA